jgi:hypothetical protein
MQFLPLQSVSYSNVSCEGFSPAVDTQRSTLDLVSGRTLKMMQAPSPSQLTPYKGICEKLHSPSNLNGFACSRRGGRVRNAVSVLDSPFAACIEPCNGF